MRRFSFLVFFSYHNLLEPRKAKLQKISWEATLIRDSNSNDTHDKFTFIESRVTFYKFTFYLVAILIYVEDAFWSRFR